MKRRMMGFVAGLSVVVASVQAWAARPLQLEKHERLITILGTNDIHGGVEAGKAKDGAPVGGLAFLAGVVKSIKKGVAARYGKERSGVLVVDSGDQFQGTLLSNYNEGQLTFAAMNEVGYDAVLPGNHDYDFGPVGWTEDQVTPDSKDQDPRGALKVLAARARFPLVSANTYLKESLRDKKGKLVPVKGEGCASSREIDWSEARHPEFLRPYEIKGVAGVKVALIGIDNPQTPSTTTPANVSDFCFDEPARAYLRARESLKGRAQVFVALLHQGNTNNSDDASRFVRALPDGAVDAVIAGHTHYTNYVEVNRVPVIQSGSGGLLFGRVDLVWHDEHETVVRHKTRFFGGVELGHGHCASFASDFCAVREGRVEYEGVPVVPSKKVEALIRKARSDVSWLADRKLGVVNCTAERPDCAIMGNRTSESPLANALTDALREVSGADVAIMNASGLRAPFQKGELVYEDLYRTIPFNNRGLLIGPMPAEKLVALFERSVKSCGAWGALMQSGLRVTFERDCAGAVDQVDKKARLLRVETLDGHVVLDRATGKEPAAGETYQVATLDFLAAGGSGFDGFKGVPVVKDLGIAREAIAERWTARPVELWPTVDGRLTERKP